MNKQIYIIQQYHDFHPITMVPIAATYPRSETFHFCTTLKYLGEFKTLELAKFQANLKWEEFTNSLLEEREIVGEQRGLSQILSQSTPLIPELEKAFDEGFHKGYGVGQGDARNHPLALTLANHIHEERQDYISNLKLDI